MSRARVAALALVNWKGVFYERYLLDRHVTALEGSNGAGKTTVMIAAYVVLLPDMSRLRFTNVGETGATGGDRGIWGRLGEPGRPSYAVLDLELAGGERVIAGVRLVRTTAPTIEPTPFVITGLAEPVRLSEILLVRQLDGDHVPELDEVAAAVTAAGGAIEIFKTTKDYFAALFERGITPMRLGSEEERGKLNEMLRTSMTGGISRVLTSELRGFLLKEETGLGDTLSRMRANLEACRRTRTEVAESRQLEREISAIYEAGQAMFGAAVHAQRAAALEAAQRVAAGEAAVEDAGKALRALDDELAAFATRARALDEHAAAARHGLERAVAERDRRAAVRAVQARLDELDRELVELAEAAAVARAGQAAATTERAAARHERTRALEAYDRAAHGLAHLQQGLDELVRRAHAHRQLNRRLADARTLIDRPALRHDAAAAVLAELDGERSRCHAERARLERDARDLEARRAEHAQAVAALAALEDGAEAAARGEPHARARAVLARLADLEAQLARVHELERELTEAERLAVRQRAARALAAGLELDLGSPGAASRVVGALAAAERTVAAAEDDERADAAADATTRRRLEELRAHHAQLDDRLARWHVATAAAARLAATGPVPATAPERAALRDRLAAEHHDLGRRRAALEAQREERQQRAAAIEQTGTAVDPELLRLRDELGGELLASRFEDLDVAAAGWVEARLGALGNALIVEDPDAAAQLLTATERTLPTVWLVRSGSTLDVEPPDDAGTARDVISAEPFGLRVTRRVDRPTLGRRARERQLRELHDAIARDGAALEQLAGRAQLVAGWRREVELLASHADALGGADPADERARLESEIATLELADPGRRDRSQVIRGRVAAARARLDGLRRLLGDAALLDDPDHAVRATELARVRDELAAARAELVRVAPARNQLGQLVDVLRHPPLDDATLAAAGARRAALDDQLDRLFHARIALEDVVAHRHAAGWSDAEAALDAQAQLAPALEHQHADARAAVHAADQAGATAEAAWETATAALQAAEARHAAAAAHRDRAAAELAGVAGLAGRVTATDDDHVRALADATAVVAELDAEARALVTSQALATERRRHTARAADEARTQVAAEVRAAGPVATGWAELRASAEADGLLHAALASHGHGGRTSIQLTAEAWTKRELLVDRVARARGGDELVTAIRELPLDGIGYLRAWQATREWLRRRVPAQVAEVADPLIALERLREHLDLLDGRLARQEGDLRGASEDVARGIDVQVRRAHGQVRRLNQQLDGIKFGSIHGIRVEIRRVDRMEQILRALRQGEAQELLFVSSLPIEEALDEIFRRYGGGGRHGGQRLLDYREYLELAVEIRRQTSAAWEPASPTRLSTGEAIGVGAALMMVVLTEWERDANLIRARRTSGSLRFLFLDEANRLSRDNLGVLFDLCRNLDLQLLIAAPEVARAEGNTTYRLVRHVTDDGREEVIVSGRRAAPAPASPELVEPPPVERELADGGA